MENITKKWVLFRSHPASSIALVALFTLFLMIPWPVGGLVRALIERYDPQAMGKLKWDSAYLQPSGGLLFTGLVLEPQKGMRVRADHAVVHVSWFDLVFLETRIKAIETPLLQVDWTLQRKNADAELDYAAPTESHLAEAKRALDAVTRLISEDGANIRSHLWLLRLNEDTLRLNETAVAVQKEEGDTWNVGLSTGIVRLRNWPMPTQVKASLVLGDTAMRLEDLDACWKEGCFEAEGKLGMDKAVSELDCELNGVPLRPFGQFALPEKSSWRGKAYGEFHWKGRIAHPSTWNAEGDAKLKDVMFLSWPFQTEGTFAGFVPVFSKRLDLSEVEVPHFSLAGSRVQIDSMPIRSSAMKCLASGHWTFPQRLDFRLKGSLSEDVYEKLPGLTQKALPRTEDGGGSFKATLSGSFAWQAITPDAEHYGTALRNLFR